MKKFKSTPQSIITRDLDQLSHKTGNIYESIVIISKRARQVSSSIKEELDAKLEEFAPTVDSLEEIFENAEQIEISKHYEKLPKATQISIDYFLEDKIYHRYKDDNN